jgi:GNAT superfamily N-acetyltransferase
MQLVPPDAISAALRALFAGDLPVGVRCRAILAGTALGRILADDPAAPTWALVQEPADATIYLGGAFTPLLLAEAIRHLRQASAVVAALWPDDPRLGWLPAARDYEGVAIDFTERSSAVSLDSFLAVPAGCRLQAVDRALFDRLPGRDWTLALFGSAERALALGLGYCLMSTDGGEILCEAFAGPVAGGLIEIGTGTPEPYQGRGYATLTCARLIQACEARGLAAFWNAAADNAASLALARKLGFQWERPFRVIAWNQLAASASGV